MHKMIFKGVMTRKFWNSIRFFLLLAFVSASLPASAQDDSLNKARAMVSMKNYQDALKIYESLYQRDPSPEIYDEYFEEDLYQTLSFLGELREDHMKRLVESLLLFESME